MLSAGLLHAQNKLLQGLVEDAQSGEPLPFVNLGVEGTTIGASTDFDGQFSMEIPPSDQSKILLVSSVGYDPIKLPVNELLGQSPVVIKLVPVDYQLEEVTINAEELFIRSILKKAANFAANNYIDRPYLYTARYRQEKQMNGQTRQREAIVKIYDAAGYGNRSRDAAFKARNYRFTQSEYSHPVRSLSDGMTDMDDLLTFDIVRLAGNVIDPDHGEFFTLDMEERMAQGDSIWEITYECTAPGLITTGDYYATSYEGTIRIRKNDYSVVDNECRAESANYNPLGRTYLVDESSQEWLPEAITYNVHTTYASHHGKYRLEAISYERQMTWKDRSSAKRNTEHIHSQLTIESIDTDYPQPIHQRQYFVPDSNLTAETTKP